MKKFYMLLAAIICLSVQGFAQNFSVANEDGVIIDYYITSREPPTVEVTAGLQNYSGTVVIPETVIYNNYAYSVTSIGDQAFYIEEELESVTIPNTVTSIGEESFYRCTGLTSLTIPNSVTTIGNRAFENCKYITSLIIGNSVARIGNYAFSFCEGLSSVILPNSVISIGTMVFSSCDFASITLSNSLESIGESAFSSNRNLTSITIPSSIKYIYNDAFFHCENLISVYYTGNIAEWCGINFGNFYSNPLYFAHDLYIDNQLVTNATIPNTVTSINQYAFYNCSALTSVSIPNSVTHIGVRAFYNTGYYYYSPNWVNGVLYIGNHLIVANGISGPYTINNGTVCVAEDAFSNCGLTSVTIPNTVRNIGEGAFSCCGNLTSFILAGGNASIETMENRRLLIQKDGSEIILLAIAPAGLTSINIPYSVTKIGKGAFKSCKRLNHVSMPGSVTNINDNAFYECDSLTNITIPVSVTSIGNYSFYSCISLTSVIWNATNVTSYVNRYTPFSGCNNLNAVVFGDMVQKIPDSAFIAKTSIRSLTFGASIDTIGMSAFYGCTNINSIHSESIIPPVRGRYAFLGIPTDIAVHVPCGCKADYESTYSWRDFTNITEMSCDVQISLSAFPAEGGTVSGDGNFITGDTVTVTATANRGYYFVNWTRDGYEVSTDATYTFTAISSRNLVANFSNGTGIEEENIHDFAIYPNPTSGIVIIDAEDVQHVEIIDINGKVINRIGKANAIDLSNLNKGIYFLRISLPQGNTIRRVVKI